MQRNSSSSFAAACARRLHANESSALKLSEVLPITLSGGFCQTRRGTRDPNCNPIRSLYIHTFKKTPIASR
ncbi:hypothetical protein BURKHO8Y_240145 [Burkholderia sp. 8Y]|nr:hypothetical protein BURKHO8Y_240145 [Burkholderia sp. 8Y]